MARPPARGAKRGAPKGRSQGQGGRAGGRGRKPQDRNPRGRNPQGRKPQDRKPQDRDRTQPEPKTSAKRGLGGDHVEGRQAVRELLIAGRRKVREVLLSADLDPAPILDDIIDLADSRRVPIREIGKGKFDAEAKTQSSQGVLARADALPDVELEQVARGKRPFLLLLDGVTDPGNLGALLRTAECAGVTGVFLPRHRAVHVSPTVTKSAAGAIEYLPMGLVGGIPAALTKLKELGVWTVGLDGETDRSIGDLDLRGDPVAVVLGAEGTGLSRLAKQRCDEVVSIPMLGQLNSLNVAAAGAISLFQFAGDRPSAR